MESSNINDNMTRFMNSINKNSNINDINHFKVAKKVQLLLSTQIQKMGTILPGNKNVLKNGDGNLSLSYVF